MTEAHAAELMTRYAVRFIPAPDGYVAVRFVDFPGIVTGGDTFEQAVANAREAFWLHVDGLEEDGVPLPAPTSESSGQLNIRVPKSLHGQLRQRAAEEGISVNALVNHLLTRSVAA